MNLPAILFKLERLACSAKKIGFSDLAEHILALGLESGPKWALLGAVKDHCL